MNTTSTMKKKIRSLAELKKKSSREDSFTRPLQCTLLQLRNLLNRGHFPLQSNWGPEASFHCFLSVASCLGFGQSYDLQSMTWSIILKGCVILQNIVPVWQTIEITINNWKFKNSNDTFNEERISKRDQWKPSSRSLWTKQWKITDFSIICTVWFVNQGICREQSGNLCVLVYVSINMMVFRENFEAWSLWKTKWRLKYVSKYFFISQLLFEYSRN